MQYFRREFVYDYTSYSFGYTEHAEFDNRARDVYTLQPRVSTVFRNSRDKANHVHG